MTAGWAARRGRYLEAIALLIGQTLALVVVRVTKAAYDRPRPDGPAGGHDRRGVPVRAALYAVTLIACAVVLVRAGAGWAVRSAAVTVAVALVAFVALSRVYLRAHYLTDVLGGVGYGLALWSLVASSPWSPGPCVTMARAARERRHDHLHSRRHRRGWSRTAWVVLIVIPAWGSYWRLRERVLAMVMSVYILAAFVGNGGRDRRRLPPLLRPDC